MQADKRWQWWIDKSITRILNDRTTTFDNFSLNFSFIPVRCTTDHAEFFAREKLKNLQCVKKINELILKLELMKLQKTLPPKK